MLILSLIFLLLSNAVTLRRDKSILYSRIAIIILLYSSLIAFYNINLKFTENEIALFGGLFHITSITLIFQIFIFIITSFILQLNGFYPRKVVFSTSLNSDIIHNIKSTVINKTFHHFRIIEYSLVILFIIIGASFLVSSSNLISLFLSLELQSYGLYILCAMYRDSESATWAALTYFLLGGLSSCLILLSTALLYANSGTTSLDGFYIISNLSDLSNNIYNVMYWYESEYVNYSLIIMSVGFLFKLSAAPFHLWSPDIYDAIPTVVTTFVAIIAKISIFVFLFELIHYTNNYFSYAYFTWTYTLLLSSLLSMIVGTLLGLIQFRIKRLLAYSTISHIGFILLSLSINSIESYQAFIFYLIQYSISNLNVFILVITIGFSLYPFVNKDKEYIRLYDKNNSTLQLISQIKGYFYINPVLSISLAITLFSFSGIPPLMGFFAKQMVLSAALDKGYIFITFIAILTSTISAVYYLNIVNKIFFSKSDYIHNRNSISISLKNNIDESNYNIIVLSNAIYISIATLLITLFMFMPQNLLSLANILAITMFHI